MAIICLRGSQAGSRLEMGLVMLLGAGVGFGQRRVAVRNPDEPGPPKRSKQEPHEEREIPEGPWLQ